MGFLWTQTKLWKVYFSWCFVFMTRWTNFVWLYWKVLKVFQSSLIDVSWYIHGDFKFFQFCTHANHIKDFYILHKMSIPWYFTTIFFNRLSLLCLQEFFFIRICKIFFARLMKKYLSSPIANDSLWKCKIFLFR